MRDVFCIDVTENNTGKVVLTKLTTCRNKNDIQNEFWYLNNEKTSIRLRHVEISNELYNEISNFHNRVSSHNAIDFTIVSYGEDEKNNLAPDVQMVYVVDAVATVGGRMFKTLSRVYENEEDAIKHQNLINKNELGISTPTKATVTTVHISKDLLELLWKCHGTLDITCVPFNENWENKVDLRVS